MGEKTATLLAVKLWGLVVHTGLRTAGFCLLWEETAEVYLRRTDVVGCMFDIFQDFLEEEVYGWSEGCKTSQVREGVGLQTCVSARALGQCCCARGTWSVPRALPHVPCPTCPASHAPPHCS